MADNLPPDVQWTAPDHPDTSSNLPPDVQWPDTSSNLPPDVQWPSSSSPSNDTAPSANGSGYFSESLDALKRAAHDISDYVGRQFSSEPAPAPRATMPSDEQIAATLKKNETSILPQSGSEWLTDSTIPMPERIAQYKKQVIGRQAAYDQQKAFDESRTPMRRATDTIAYGASLPIRAATYGKYGMGDILPVNQEESFVRANPGVVSAINQAASVGVGIPMLSTMGGSGALSAGLEGATTRLGAARAAKEAVPVAGEAEAGATKAPPEAPFENTFGPTQRLALAEAMRAAGVPQFSPALMMTPTARMFRTGEEVPIAGRVISSKNIAAQKAADTAKQNIVQSLNPAESAEEAGLTTQNALDRFRTARLQDLPREDVQALGINPDRLPAATREGYVAIGDPENLSTAGMSPAELELMAKSRVQLPGQLRTTVQDLSPAENELLINAPDWQTSFRTKQEALYKRAEDAVPPMMKYADNANPDRVSANNMLFATRNAASVIDGIKQTEKSMGINGGITTGSFWAAHG